MKNLVIVESPTKARTIGRFLSGDYIIKASMGHIFDLPKSKLGVDEKTFEPAYEIVSEKRMAIADLKDGSKKADAIIIATDPDREGEAIASHIKDMLAQDKKLNIKNKKVLRIVFHEITKEAIEDALKSPRDIDEALVNAQTARRVLDRLVGYKISPVLWQKVRRGLSAGRVQSVALRLIVEREREIEKFKKEKYYTITAVMVNPKSQITPASTSEAGRANNKEETEFELIEINSEKIEIQQALELYDGQYRITKSSLDSEKKAKDVAQELNKKNFVVSDVLKKETRRSPYPPYTTSTLQQDASRRFGFPGRRTMSLAQKLYEEGFITYHRTDSVSMAQSAVVLMRKFVEVKFGNKYLSSRVRVYKTKQKLAQEAHEAIRPTRIQNSESIVQNELGRDFAKLYELIWTRAVATQMADAVIESTTVIVDSKKVILSEASNVIPSGNEESQDSSAKPQNDNRYRLRASGSVLLFDGFLKITPQILSDNILPDFKTGENLTASEIFEKEHETLPPPRYNEASLIATLEEKGIGRPSTYATIVSTIEGRKYTEREESRFKPTPIGVAVNDFLVKNFSTIDDIPFTASMEEELDAIANEKKEWAPVIKKFYDSLSASLKDVKSADRMKILTEEIDEECPTCSAPLVIRYGKFGKFLSCSTFPDCKFTKPFVEEIGIVCPKCGKEKGGQVITRKTRKGRKFFGCSNYPNCDFAAWKLQDLEKYKQ